MLATELQLPGGKLRGVERDADGVLAFRGIPFAAPPIGPLRWRAPQDVEPWTGVRDATIYGAPAFGSRMPGFRELSHGMSEDCLTLNVWTPAEAAGERLPVLVWIHGGGFVFGNPTAFGTEGHRLAAKGAVVVSMGYRLGVFGFLAHPELDHEGETSGNYGLQDQIKALEWVRDNIAMFGGDPDNVTLFGESAGSHAVGLLMASPPARGLFHKAIGESGAFWDSENGSIPTKAEAQARGLAFADRLGGGTIAGLRAIPADRLNRACPWNFLRNPIMDTFTPNIDGHVIPATPTIAFEQGLQADVPLLAGWNRDEHAFFVARALPHRPPAALRAAATEMFGAGRLDDFLRVYPAGNRQEAKRSAELLVGDMTISEQTWEWLGMHRRTSTAPVYAYNYQYASPYSPRPVHGAEMAFVFGSIDESYVASKAKAGPEDKTLSERMMSYWVNFARAGDPNGVGLPHWPAYDGPGTQVMRFAETTAAAPEDGTDRFRFIQSFRRNGRFPEHWRQTKTTMPPIVATVLAKLLLTFR